jgi:hypothetical protein
MGSVSRFGSYLFVVLKLTWLLDPRADSFVKMTYEDASADNERGQETMASWLRGCQDTHSLC